MKIVADENIPFVKEAFGTLGDVVTSPGRRIEPCLVRGAEMLLVRSVTRVDEALLRESNIRFVATATIGCDHVDTGYLAGEGIGFASAAGSNANSVAEYVVAALLIFARRYGFLLSDRTIGVVGVGNVGSRVVRKADVLNMDVLQNDPPLARETGQMHFRPLEELLAGSDIVTLHVPLTHEGEDATYHMANGRLFERMKKGSIFLNTSRGAVAASADLLRALQQKRLGGALLDVWEDEPGIDEELLGAVDLGTPHIAGYSYDGKVNGTSLVYQAACQFLKVRARWQPPALPSPRCPKIEVEGEGRNEEEILAEVVRKAYDLERDDGELRRIANMPLTERKKFFDRLRSEYPLRREFSSMEVQARAVRRDVKQKLEALGFQINTGTP